MPLITTPRPSFKEFKELVTIHKFSPQGGFVLLYGYDHEKRGFKYRTKFTGGNKEQALKAAYILFYGESTPQMVAHIEVCTDENRGLKMPLSTNFNVSYNLAYRNFDMKNLVVS